MMKRILMVFLLLIMQAGCVKSLPEVEKPVESPDIVQSDIHEEQGKPEVSAILKANGIIRLIFVWIIKITCKFRYLCLMLIPKM